MNKNEVINYMNNEADLKRKIFALIDKSKDDSEFAKEIIKLLCGIFNCSWGTFWKVEGALLKQYALWESPELSALQLNLDSKFKSFHLNEGTAGQVWKTQKIVWSSDITIDMCLPRSLDAYEAGLKAGIWLPIGAEGIVFGVIELLAKELPRINQNQLSLLYSMDSDIGHAMQKLVKKLS